MVLECHLRIYVEASACLRFVGRFWNIPCFLAFDVGSLGCSWFSVRCLIAPFLTHLYCLIFLEELQFWKVNLPFNFPAANISFPAHNTTKLATNQSSQKVIQLGNMNYSLMDWFQLIFYKKQKPHRLFLECFSI